MKLLDNLFMKTFYREVGQHWIQYKITYTMVYNNIGFSGVQRIFNMVYITDYTKKDIQCQRHFAIILIQADLLSQNLQK